MTARFATSSDQAVADIQDGSTVLIGGFGRAGMPVDLIDALIRQGATNLTVVSNNAGNGDTERLRAGGAMDLAIGAKQVFVMMTLMAKGRHRAGSDG